MAEPMTVDQLRVTPCAPRRSGDDILDAERRMAFLALVPGWHVDDGEHAIVRELTVGDFRSAVDLFDRIATLADAIDHHPDLHLTGYRRVRIVASTHSVGGVTINDFVLAARIDEILSKFAGERAD